ncbi:MAG: undecaprenyl-phosphate galactose phosphotransferase WbaP [Acidobacteriota bacterium]|nr:undecaprenyl-phosphate galactose phosphotransferase WbaP [Acidobacteriota bacterium]
MTPLLTMTASPPRPAVHHCRPACMIACLVAGDAFCLAAAGLFAVLIKLIPAHNVQSIDSYLRLAPLLPVFLLVYAAIGLYSGISLGPPEELRRLTLSSILVSLFVGVLTVSFRGTGTFFTWAMAEALFLSVFLVPLTRVCMRMMFADVSWWGYPTVVFGDRKNAEAIIRTLIDEPGLGLKPIGFFSHDSAMGSVHGVPSLSSGDLADLASRIEGPAYAVLTACEASREGLKPVIDCYRRSFSHILVIPEFSGFSCLWVNPKNLGGLLGLEIYQQVFVPSRQILKRAIDLLLTALITVAASPVMLAVAIAVKFDSPGPILFGHRRIGRGGREFRAWKFRSMVGNAEAILRDYLDQNPDAREEWNKSQKLRKDPRVTRLGEFLRRTSLDELPQLWNVLCGEMSLVGPRPIVQDEIARYGIDFEKYKWVQGGLTGLWQVSGRSDTTYAERVDYDCFYVHNWSVWLDLCILFRTIGTVLSRAGAF